MSQCSHERREQLLIGHISPPGITWHCCDCGARWFEEDMNRKKLSRIHAERMTLDRILFGSDAAPNTELGVERAAIIVEFRAVQADWNEPNAGKLWKYLEEAHRSYDVEKDGRSRIMLLVDRVHEHIRKEEHASRSGVATPSGSA